METKRKPKNELKSSKLLTLNISLRKTIRFQLKVVVTALSEKTKIESSFAVNVIETKTATIRNMQMNFCVLAGVRIRQNGGLGSEVDTLLMVCQEMQFFDADGIPLSAHSI
jgi:hypothetical protein